MTNLTNTTTEDVQDATVMAAFDAADASYGSYIGSEINYGSADEALLTAGWTEITAPTVSSAANVSKDNFQGVAYYKTINGSTSSGWQAIDVDCRRSRRGCT